MNAPTAPAPPLTTDQMLALPENGVDRELIRGELREKPMATRSPDHSEITVNLSYLLKTWLRGQQRPRGRAYAGEARFRLRRNPDTTVGIDVAYISPELAAATPRRAKLVDGPPALAIEIVSPSDLHEELTEKVEEYLAAGVPLVWVVDPFFQTVQVHRPGREPESYNIKQSLSADRHLPGFNVDVAEIFAD